MMRVLKSLNWSLSLVFSALATCILIQVPWGPIPEGRMAPPLEFSWIIGPLRQDAQADDLLLFLPHDSVDDALNASADKNTMNAQFFGLLPSSFANDALVEQQLDPYSPIESLTQSDYKEWLDIREPLPLSSNNDIHIMASITSLDGRTEVIFSINPKDVGAEDEKFWIEAFIYIDEYSRALRYQLLGSQLSNHEHSLLMKVINRYVNSRGLSEGGYQIRLWY